MTLGMSQMLGHGDQGPCEAVMKNLPGGSGGFHRRSAGSSVRYKDRTDGASKMTITMPGSSRRSTKCTACSSRAGAPGQLLRLEQGRSLHGGLAQGRFSPRWSSGLLKCYASGSNFTNISTSRPICSRRAGRRNRHILRRRCSGSYTGNKAAPDAEAAGIAQAADRSLRPGRARSCLIPSAGSGSTLVAAKGSRPALHRDRARPGSSARSASLRLQSAFSGRRKAPLIDQFHTPTGPLRAHPAPMPKVAVAAARAQFAPRGCKS